MLEAKAVRCEEKQPTHVNKKMREYFKSGPHNKKTLIFSVCFARYLSFTKYGRKKPQAALFILF